jgi:hypothetical protein
MMFLKRSANLCIVLVLASSMILAQKSKTPPVNAVEMREHQLRVFREHVFARVLDNIKKMDDAGLRVSARNQILTYLATEKNASDERETLATQVARDALMDLREHDEEIGPFMLSYLANDLVSWIQKHGPNLLEDFEKTIDAMAKIDASLRVRSLLGRARWRRPCRETHSTRARSAWRFERTLPLAG